MLLISNTVMWAGIAVILIAIIVVIILICVGVEYSRNR